MSWQELTIDIFLDRLAEMPDVEAVQEIDLRLARVNDQRTAVVLRGLHTVEANERLTVLKADEARLRSERHLVVMRMDSRKWSKAVRALWGQEGVEQVLVWFEVNGEPETKQVALYPKAGRR